MGALATFVDDSNIKVGSITNVLISSTGRIDVSKFADGSVANTAFQFVSGVTSNIQTQFGNKYSISGILRLPAGGTASNTAPLMFNTGSMLSVVARGSLEYDGQSLFFTPSGTRRIVPLFTNVSTTTTQAAFASAVSGELTVRAIAGTDLPTTQVCCLVENSGGVSLGTSYIAIPYAMEVRKDTGTYTHGLGAASTGVVVLTAGDYLITSDLGFIAGGQGNVVTMSLLKNGVQISGSIAIGEDNIGGGSHASATLVQTFAANDVLAVQAKKSVGGVNSTVAEASRLTLIRLW